MDFIPSDSLMITGRLLLTALLAGIIGVERETKQQPAGLRTHLLVGLGACLMMILNITGFDAFIGRDAETIRFDPARIPSYVISGIGFLGAGTIIVHKGSVKGLTTAASVWVAAGLGLVVGIGMYFVAVLTTLIVLGTLYILGELEKRYTAFHKKKSISIIAGDREKVFSAIRSCFDECNIQIMDFRIENAGSYSDLKISAYTFSFLESDTASELKLIAKLEKLDGVLKINL